MAQWKPPIDEDEIVERFIAAYTQISQWSKHDFKHTRLPGGLSSTQFAILALIELHPGMNTSHLAERLDLTVPTVVRAVDALERKGLVTRSRGAMDRREVVIAATPEGSRAREAVSKARRERLKRLLALMTEDDVHRLVQGFEGMALATTVAGERPDHAHAN